MSAKGSSMKHKEIITDLKKLSDEDRLILGLYLYEGLNQKQVSAVLNAQQNSISRSKRPGKPLMKKLLNTY